MHTNTITGLKIGEVCINIPTKSANEYPITTPIIPPKNVKITASIRN